ncbi:nuclear transport factor 2 family protein [Algoriphagus sp.]|uniref:nuclear transport factor 2 family protein n=1 Tax=Algoriphagus sp. TaxID=1872435 RepID=UPI0025CEAAB6|nr:nuclear transport factor 2 family protein [Algoriphagus sp.]
MKKSIFFGWVFIMGLFFFQSLELVAQEAEIAQIKAQREASNEALRNFNEELNSTFLTDDILITTGAGTLISGKAALMDYIKNATGPRMFWVRTADEIIVNPVTKLAWETGTWKGYVEGSNEAAVGGNYSAQWTKKTGAWLIQSQLFVTLSKD